MVGWPEKNANICENIFYPFTNEVKIEMKYFFLLLSGLALCSCSKQDASVDIQSDISAITAVSKARADAFNAGDAAGIAQYFTEDGLLMAPGNPVSKGRSAVEDYYAEIFSAYAADLESYYEEVEVTGELGYGRGEAKVRLVDKITGDTTYSSSKYLNILKKQADGSWKTTHDIWNDN